MTEDAINWDKPMLSGVAYSKSSGAMTTLAYTITGLVIFGCALTVYTACRLSGEADEQSERLWRDTHEGEDDGDQER